MPSEIPCPFEDAQIAGRFHHTDRCGIPSRIAAHGADVLIRQVEADSTGSDLLRDGPQRIGQKQCVALIAGQQKMRDSLGGLRPNSRELRELLD